MPKSHPPYAPEFRRQMVDLVVKGSTTPPDVFNIFKLLARVSPAAADLRVTPG